MKLQWTYRRHMAQLALFGCAYCFAAVLGLQWAQIRGAGSPVWPAFGISLAFMILYGPRFWPAIFLGRLAAGFIVGSDQPLWAEIAIAGANSLADSLAVLALRGLGGIDRALSRIRDVLMLSLAVVGSAMLSASLGSTTLWLSSGLDGPAVKTVWIGWWFGNVVAGLTITPLLLSATRARLRTLWGNKWRALFPVMIVSFGMTVAMLLQPQDGFLRPWHSFPAFIWTALATGPLGSAIVLTVISFLMIIGADISANPFFATFSDPAVQITLAQQFAAVSAFTTLVLAAAYEEVRTKAGLEERARTLKEANDHLRAVIEPAALGSWHYRFDIDLLEVNDRWAEMLGLDRRALGQGLETWHKRIHPDDLASVDEALKAHIDGIVATYSVEHRMRHAQGHWVWILTSGRIISRDEQDAPLIMTGTHLDISDRKAAEDQLRASEARAVRLAYYDSLTGLPNRRMMQERLQQQLGDMRRNAGSMAVLLLDLDNFKSINDSLGHLAGDDLLRQVAGRLTNTCRETDIVARLGGDEFIIIQPHANGYQAAHLADRILAALSMPFEFTGGRAYSGTSIGIAVIEDGHVSPDEVLRLADVALYRAKNNGRGRYAFFEPEFDAALKLRRALGNDLHRALDSKDELFLVYQPQFNVDRQIVGYEALLRWRHPERGILHPVTFVSIAEETGLIDRMGHYVLDRVISETRDWSLPVAFNVSPSQLRSPRFTEDVQEALYKAGLPPRRIEIEVTESILLGEDPMTMRNMETLEQIGVCLTLDDFGVGYSNLGILKRFRIRKLKIDRSFVTDLDVNEQSRDVVRAILGLAYGLGIEVVAEGIESQAQFKQLKILGCRIFQGYFLAEPLEADKIVAYRGKAQRLT